MDDFRELAKKAENSSIYSDLVKNISCLRDAEEVEDSGIDGFFEKASSNNRIVVGSMSELVDFFRVSKDTLVHKAEKDLWRLTEKNGQVVIERLFDPNGKPLRV